ncbi:MAG: pyrroline-5-carboxylate reductase [Rhodospirillaceae bacterium]|nr:pyrroline-5-carboxylate reductase [Rhodospirillaceae bacterium]
MQTRNRFFDDAAKIAGGAIGTLEGIRREVEVLVRQQVERLLNKFDLVTRDEFEAVKEMAARTRKENEEILKRVKDLEPSKNSRRITKKTPRRKKTNSKKT